MDDQKFELIKQLYGEIKLSNCCQSELQGLAGLYLFCKKCGARCKDLEEFD